MRNQGVVLWVGGLLVIFWLCRVDGTSVLKAAQEAFKLVGTAILITFLWWWMS